MEAFALSSSAISLFSSGLSSRGCRLICVSALKKPDSGDESGGGDIFRRPRDGSGKVVDEGMIVLRKRIHEMKMLERNYDEPPSEWMDWEKEYYTRYDSIVCDLVDVLQSCLMESRPSVVLGVVVLLSVSVPISSIVVVLHFLGIARSFLSGVHLI